MSDAQYEEIPGEVPRDRFGRPLIIPLGGGRATAYTRCTTFVGALEDTYNLGQRQQRMAVAGIANRPDLHLRAVSLGAPPVEDGTPQAEAFAKRWKADMNRVVDEARNAAAASAAATIGTSLHALTEVIDRGGELNMATIPDRYRTHLDNYRRETARMHAVEVERFVVHDDLQIGGTADRVLRIDGHDGLFIGDLKTGSVEYGAGKIAMQLSVYAHSVKYDPVSGARAPINGLRTDRGIVVHLDAKTGRCELLWVDLAAAWEAVSVAGWVRGWRKRKGLLTPAADLAPDAPPIADAVDQATGEIVPPDATSVAIEQAIAQAATRDDLSTLWAEADARGLWTAAHTEAAKARLDHLTQVA